MWGELSRIGEETCEKLDYIPAKVQVIRHIRPKYACKHCEGVEDDGPTVRIAPVPVQLIPKSIATEGLLAHIAVSKFADALCLYRQQKIFNRLGVELSRATLANWMIQAAVLLPDHRIAAAGNPKRAIDQYRRESVAGAQGTGSKQYHQVVHVGVLRRPAIHRWFCISTIPREVATGVADFSMATGVISKATAIVVMTICPGNRALPIWAVWCTSGASLWR